MNYSNNLTGIKLEDFGLLQARYQAMPLSSRASAVLNDAEPALQAAEDIISTLISKPKIKQILDGVRKNPAITGKMRPSEAKNLLMDGSQDFLDVTRKKLAAWRKTMERLSRAEGVVIENNQEFISRQAPLAAAMTGVLDVSSYLSVAQIALSEMVKADGGATSVYASLLTKIRRCGIFISDCENAASFASSVH